jgi:cytochrome c556
MTRRLSLLTAAFAMSVMACSPAMAQDADPDAIIKYRKGVMSAIGAKANALAAILKGDVNLPDALGPNAEALAASTNAAVITGAFRQNTDGQGNERTTATAKIWEDWDRFEKASNDLQAAALEVNKAAAAGELTSFDQLKPVFAQCGVCHKDAGFRD